MLTIGIESALKRSTHHRELLDVMNYAVLPAGKMFRPRLVEAISLDLEGKVSEDAIHLASAIEIHHAYTLVHDDLPSMDNDLVRRGKPSTHAHYGEWKAVLAGDALLIQSFYELGQIKSDSLPELLKFMAWSTGAKGLIFGQYLDLQAKTSSFKDIVRIHELKTARLIQLALVGSHLISTGKFSKKYLKLGSALGISFQLIDDLTDLATTEVSEHEKEINPFLKYPGESFSYLLKNILFIKQTLKEEKLNTLFQEVYSYLHSMTKVLKENEELILTHSTSKDFRPALDQLILDLTSGEII